MSGMKLYLTSPSYLVNKSDLHGLSLAQLDYSIGPGRRLRRSARAVAYQGSIMVLTDEGFTPGDCSYLVKDVGRECDMRGYSGVLADFEQEYDYTPLLTRLSARLRSSGKALYVPERYHTVENASVVVSTAISGGSLHQYLEELCDKYGKERITLDIQPLQMDFILPSPSGNGTPIDNMQLQTLLKKRGAQPFYSVDLCAYYFTYSEGGVHHFVLYDNASSIKKKISTAEALGISCGFLLHSEVGSILSEICN